MGWKTLVGVFALLVGLALSSEANAGGCCYRQAGKVSAMLGIQIPADASLAVGSSFDAKVVAPAKMGGRGLPGLKVDQTVHVTVTADGEFSVSSGGKTVTLAVDDKGAVRGK